MTTLERTITPGKSTPFHGQTWLCMDCGTLHAFDVCPTCRLELKLKDLRHRLQIVADSINR